MTINSKHFQILAQHDGRERTSTRAAAASAMVLADLWASQGCQDIQLIDPQGIARSRESFRASVVRIRKPMSRVW